MDESVQLLLNPSLEQRRNCPHETTNRDFPRILIDPPLQFVLQAYKMRPSSAVQIAKIVSVAVIVASLIIGCFILASSYIQARAACDQMAALDNMLNKELMLDSMMVRSAVALSLNLPPIIIRLFDVT